ncbi:MAG: hypothetical protein ACI9CF_001510, partial [Candidatus Omnitrophota bacterium]
KKPHFHFTRHPEEREASDVRISQKAFCCGIVTSLSFLTMTYLIYFLTSNPTTYFLKTNTKPTF